ncbi:hypothetical protein AAHA92_20993 [Salvia divinorum]|uniref:RING-type domain-containing protein n=1 Tax=Salvia divinorum TaxID=28513 RepID=A0ABD1GJB6_SALDI
METRAVQVLLRGRFLRNGSLAVYERPSSVAATELGFLDKDRWFPTLGSASAISVGSDSCYNDENKGEGESTCTEGRVTGNHIAAGLEGTTVDLEVIDETDEPVLVDERSLEDASVCAGSVNSIEESVLVTEARQNGACSHAEDEDMNLTFRNEFFLESAEINCSGSSYESKSGESYVHEVDDNTTGLEGNTNEEFNLYDASPEEYQESVTAIKESIAQNVNTVAFTEWVDGSRQDSDRSWQERASSQLFPGPSGNNVEEQDQIQESHDWPGHDFQEAIDSWRGMPSSEAGESVREVATAYFPDDDKGNTVELRELFRWRCLSSLLRSSFLHPFLLKLSQTLNSYIVSNLWLHPRETHLCNLQHFFEASQHLWNEDLRVTDWAHHYLNQQSGTEWEAINELRIDMARLMQRMNNVKALNRPISSKDAPKDNRVHDESQLDHVKRGICCICQHSKIDSFLYRCGHMCTCTNCAENQVQSQGKCPMCCAPAVETVLVYFVQ